MVLTAILLMVMVLQVFVSIKIHSWEPLVATGVIWVFFAAWAFIGTRYRIFLCDGKIVRQAFGKPDVVIALSDITDVKNEVSDVSTLVKLKRPLRRITVYGKDGKFIDISLKHFAAQDVDKLLDEIRVRRPELVGDRQ
jgi:hypothetical protein